MSMKLLKDMLQDINVKLLIGDVNVLVKKIVFNSQKCEKGTLFCAIKGDLVNGHKFIDDAIDFGAKCIMCEQLPIKLKKGITYIQVFDSRESLGLISNNFFNHPSKKIKVIGITGTNGKTTIATLLFELFTSLQYKCGLISTIDSRINNRIIPSNSTTPDSLRIHELLNEMILDDCQICFMEVSSHGIKQKRISGINFSFAVFTNISRDHLDYHENLEDYILTKKKFFDHLNSNSIAIINQDDKYGQKMILNCESKKIFYSINSKTTNHKAEILKNTLSGLEIKIDGNYLKTKITGFFNVYNLLAIYAIATRIHSSKIHVLNRLGSLKNILGRFNVIKIGNEINAIIDYAHSPGAIESVFQSISTIKSDTQNIITVVGCGGNRDVGKRPMMGNISYSNSDITIFTSDNPRDEDILKIINEMSVALKKQKNKKLFKIEDRREAITKAIQLARRGDIVLILGKGHEKYQEIKGKELPFDDYKVLQNILK